jgi:hypothetical protein
MKENVRAYEIKAVVYDLDVLFIDPIRVTCVNLVHALKGYAKQQGSNLVIPPQPVFLANYDGNVQRFVAGIMPGIDFENFWKFYLSDRCSLPCQYGLENGVSSTLDFTGKLGNHGVVTTSNPTIVSKMTGDADLNLRLFEFNFGLETGQSKDLASLLEKSLDFLFARAIQNKNVAYVSTAYSGYEAAKNRGLDFIGVLKGRDILRLDKLSMDGVAILPSIDQLPGYIERHNAKVQTHNERLERREASKRKRKGC